MRRRCPRVPGPLSAATAVTLHVAGTLRIGQVIILERPDRTLALWLIAPDGRSERLDADLEESGLAPRAGRIYLRTDGFWPVVTRELERSGVLLRTGRIAAHEGGGRYTVYATATPITELEHL